MGRFRSSSVALATDSLTLLAWAAATNDGGLQEAALRFGGAACCDVTAAAQQVHGAIGFALETGLHVYHRRETHLNARGNEIAGKALAELIERCASR